MTGTIGHGKIEYKNFNTLTDERFNGVWTVILPQNTLTNDAPTSIVERNKERDIIIILENLYSNDILYQKLECQGYPYTYIRMATKKDANVSRQNLTFTNIGEFKFTEWKRESFMTDSSELITKLSKFSKAYANDKYMSKDDKIEKKLFRYKGKTKLTDMDQNTVTGFYSITTTNTSDNINEKEFLERNLLSVNNGDLEYKIRSKELHYEYEKANDKNLLVNAVLEVYDLEKVVFQRLHISYPIIHHLSRYYNKETNRWSWWRGLETIDLLGTSTWLNPKLYFTGMIPCYSSIKIDPKAKVNITQGFITPEHIKDKIATDEGAIYDIYNPNVKSAPVIGSNVLGYITPLDVSESISANYVPKNNHVFSGDILTNYKNYLNNNKITLGTLDSIKGIFTKSSQFNIATNDKYWARSLFPKYKENGRINDNIPYTSSLAIYWDTNNLSTAISYRQLKYNEHYIVDIFDDDFSNNY